MCPNGTHAPWERTCRVPRVAWVARSGSLARSADFKQVINAFPLGWRFLSVLKEVLIVLTAPQGYSGSWND